MQNVYVVGVGMTPFGRHLEKSVKDLSAWAIKDALNDANCTAENVEIAFFGNCTQGALQGQDFIRGQVALLPQQFYGIPIFNIENACATASSTFHLAFNHLRGGGADVALAVGVEKMFSKDKAKMLAVFNSGWDVETVSENTEKLVALGANFNVPPGTTSDKAYSVFMDIYAAFGRQLMKRYGLTQRQIASVSSKNHVHSVHNVRSQYRDAMTVDEVLTAPPITYPLTLPMCSPISDGAAAAILCNEEGLKRLGLSKKRAVLIRASVMRSATNRDADDLENHITRLTADMAYEQAGLGPSDVDVAEVHDATAIGELIQMENLRLCEVGQSGSFVESGATTIGGHIPINPSGGLESKGHPVGATGLGQIFELVSQLRGECGKRQVNNPRIALQENGGGLWGFEEAIAHIGILEKASF